MKLSTSEVKVSRYFIVFGPESPYLSAIPVRSDFSMPPSFSMFESPMKGCEERIGYAFCALQRLA
jgi:hypothetical protein